jgi:trehalose/maltose hydrolase-like predicted phosphorylase
LNTDIALAHWQYYQSTKDTAWLMDKGWPIIKSVADMFAAFVVPNKKPGVFDTILVGEPVSIPIVILRVSYFTNQSEG